MTVLAKYQRLEAEGIWRSGAQAQRRDVIISIGDATITISAANGTALTHWSLPAMERLNPGERPALYRPSGDSPETLEVAEDEMTDALEQVLKSIKRGTGGSNRFRRLATLGVALAILGGAALWLPSATIRYTASLVPDVARGSIGASLLGEMDRVAGAPCASPAGLRALENLKRRLFGTGGPDLVVLASTLRETSHLPGGTILISHTLVEDFETPDVLAGYILAEDIRLRQEDPLARLLDFAGLRAALGLLLQGKVPDTAIRRMAEGVVAETPGVVSDTDLLALLDAKQVPAKPYALARDFSGTTTAALVQASAPTGPLILEDGDWIALQRICES